MSLQRKVQVVHQIMLCGHMDVVPGKVKGKKRRRLTLRHEERLNAKGTINGNVVCRLASIQKTTMEQ